MTNTSWALNVIQIENDTAFFESDSNFTYNYNYKYNKGFLEKYGDSAKINEIAFKKFHDSKTMKIYFKSDSIFTMTKMRSGGRIFSNELDSGTFKIVKDSLFMVINSRNNYRINYLIDNNKLKYNEVNPSGQKVYCEYKKND